MTILPRVSCIVPAYNEGPRIRAVLETVLETPEIGEVIVVEDGSTDNTAEIVGEMTRETSKLKLIRQPVNGGKTRAVVTGVRAARGDFIVLVDSDLDGLEPDDLTRLIEPVLAGSSDVSLSLRRNAPLPWHWLGIDYISGERVMPRSLLADHGDELLRLPRFALEVYMNRLWIEARFRIAVIGWPGVSSPMKYRKKGLIKGLLADAAMMRDIFRTISPVAAVIQIVTMRARRIENGVG